MIEVFLVGHRWEWRLIGVCGRTLVASRHDYPCDVSANEAAKRYRSAFWAIADGIDHRQARCI